MRSTALIRECAGGGVDVLGRIGPDAREAAPRLHQLVREEGNASDWISCQAFHALTKITPDDPVMYELAKDIALEGETYTLSYIYEGGKTAQPVIRDLVMTLPDPPVDLLEAFIGNGGQLADIEQHLIRGISAQERLDEFKERQSELYDLDEEERKEFADEIRRMRTQRTYLEELGRWVKNILRYRAGEYNPLLEKWRSELDTSGGEFRLFIIRNFWQLSPDTLPDLQYFLLHGAGYERRAAVDSCGRLQGDAVELADELTAALKDDHLIARGVCAILITMGDAGVEQLAEIARWCRIAVSEYAIETIGKHAAEIGPEVVELMCELLVCTDKRAQAAAYEFLNDNTIFSDEINEMLPRIEKLIESEDKILEGYAFSIVCSRRYGQHTAGFDPEARPTAVERAAKEDPNPLVRAKARAVLDPVQSSLLEEGIQEYLRKKFSLD